MRFRFHSGRTPRARGFSLIECLIYMSLLFVILLLAYEAFEHVQFSSQRLRRNTDDIVASLRAGEQWREDIRQAVAAPKMENDVLIIPQVRGMVNYELRNGSIFRSAFLNASTAMILHDVKTSRIIQDNGAQVTSWRWELELKTMEKKSRIKPLFTFQAVPGFAAK